MSLIESKTMCFGLLLIVNDIGDPHDTLPKSVLWVKNDTMISKDPSGSRYKLWQFNCVSEGGYREHRSGVANEIWKIVNPELTDITKLLGMYRGSQGQRGTLQLHLRGNDLQNVQNTHWLLSKTGEVNLTKFKQDKKAAIAKFLAKSVEGGEVVEIRDRWLLNWREN